MNDFVALYSLQSNYHSFLSLPKANFCPCTIFIAWPMLLHVFSFNYYYYYLTIKKINIATIMSHFPFHMKMLISFIICLSPFPLIWRMIWYSRVPETKNNIIYLFLITSGELEKPKIDIQQYSSNSFSIFLII